MSPEWDAQEFSQDEVLVRNKHASRVPEGRLI